MYFKRTKLAVKVAFFFAVGTAMVFFISTIFLNIATYSKQPRHQHEWQSSFSQLLTIFVNFYRWQDFALLITPVSGFTGAHFKLLHRATAMSFIKHRIRPDAEPAGLNMNNPQ
jgi:hypothetical protein